MDTLDILKSILGGNATGSKRVEEIKRRPSRSGRAGGGLNDVLGDVLGGGRRHQQQQQHQPQRPEPTDPGELGSMLEDLLGVGGAGSTPARRPVPVPAPEPQTQIRPEPRQRPTSNRSRERYNDQEADQATILIRAMCNAAKVDGDIDKQEQDAIISRLGEVTQAAIDFIRNELSSPLDLAAYCRSVPPALSRHAYAFSVMAITIDTLNEAAYLGRLGAGLDLDPKACNEIHDQIGAPCLYASLEDHGRP